MKHGKVINEVFLQEDFFGLTRGLPMRLVGRLNRIGNTPNYDLWYEPVHKVTPNERYEYNELRYICSKLHPDDKLLKSPIPISKINMIITTDGTSYHDESFLDTNEWPDCSFDFYASFPIELDWKYEAEYYRTALANAERKVRNMFKAGLITGRLEELIAEMKSNPECLLVNGNYTEVEQIWLEDKSCIEVHEEIVSEEYSIA